MSDSRFRYNCTWGRNQLEAVLRLLARHGVVSGPIYDGLIDRTFRPCTSCRRRHPPKYCHGWRVALSSDSLNFAPVAIDGRSLVLEIAAICDFRRNHPMQSREWEGAPVGEANFSLTLLLEDMSAPLEHHHIDFANPGQSGPIWHLQYAGNPPAREKLPSSWLSEPRWLLLPCDYIQALEQVVMNFYPDAWEALSDDGEWIRLVQGAERLSMTAYVSRLENHLSRIEMADSTWLMVSDNRRGELEIRPAKRE